MKRVLLWSLLGVLVLPFALAVWIAGSESGLRWTLEQARGFIPGELQYEQINGRLLGPLDVANVNYRDSQVEVNLDRLVFDWRPSALLLGLAHITTLQLRGLEVTTAAAAEEEEAPKKSEPIALPDIRLPLRIQLDDFDVQGFRLYQGDDPIVELERAALQANADESGLHINVLEVVSPLFRVAARGSIQPIGDYVHDVNIAWHVDLPDYPKVNGNGRLHGDLQETRLEHELSGPITAELTAQAQQLLGQLRWQTEVNIRDVDVASVNKEWPQVRGSLQLHGHGDLAQVVTNGQFDVSYPDIGDLKGQYALQRRADGSVMIDTLTVRHPKTGGRVSVQGQWQPTDQFGHVDATMTWQKLGWPLSDSPDFESASGNLHLKGSLDDYSLKLTTQLAGSQVPKGQWLIEGHGGPADFKVRQLNGKTLDGELNGHGRVQWQPTVTWEAVLDGREINPGSQWPDWPGQLAFSIGSVGELRDAKINADIDLRTVKGTLRDFPVAGRTETSLRGEEIQIRALHFQSGSSRVELSGIVGEKADLDWKLHSPDLGQLYPEAGGTLSAEGSIKGKLQKPKVIGTLSGRDMVYQDYAIGEAQGAMAIDFLTLEAITVELDASHIAAPGYQITAVRVSGSGSEASHQLTTIVESPDVGIDLRLEGGFKDDTWHGILRQADINTQKFSAWKLRAPAKIAVATNAVNVNSTCWESEGSLACIEAQQRQGRWTATTSLSDLELARLNAMLPGDFQLESKINFEADVHYAPGAPLLANAHVAIGAGAVSFPIADAERRTWQFDRGEVNLIANRSGIEANIALALANGDFLKANAQLPQADVLALDPDRQKVTGEVNVAIKDLSLIEALVTDIQALRGKLGANITVSGTIGVPRIQGAVSFENGGLNVPTAGITLSDITLKAKSEDLKRITYSLDARSNEGTLQVTGETQLAPDEGWPSRIDITGRDFEVARIPEANVQLSPQLTVELKQRTVRINGEIRVPLANLQPKDVSSAKRVSSDAVVLGEEQAPEEKWLTHSRVRVILGKRVRFYGFGFDGRFEGNFVVIDEPGQPTKASGEINIPEGRYRAYGQRLDVEHGRVLFTGGPVTEPGLDIRAVRNVGEVKAGVKIRGTVKSPKIELYSEPAMGETEALSYLVLGRPLDQESGEDGEIMAQAAVGLGLVGGDLLARRLGQRFGFDEMRIDTTETGDASLVIGHYLSPKVYVSYGVGLLKPINTVNIRYQLTKRLQLEATSGTHQGADVIYTIER